jgi:hypothetical protein
MLRVISRPMTVPAERIALLNAALPIRLEEAGLGGYRRRLDLRRDRRQVA